MSISRRTLKPTQIVTQRQSVSTNPVACRERGLSILEPSSDTAELAVVGAPIILMATQATNSTAEADNFASVLERNRTSLRRVAADIRDSFEGDVTISNSNKTLSLRLVGSFTGSGGANGDLVTYTIQSDPTDADNGSDDNGNGLVDEKILVRTNLTTSELVTISTNIEDATSGFEANGDGVTVTLTTHGVSRRGAVETLSRMTRAIVAFPQN